MDNQLTAREKAVQDLLWPSLQRDPEHKDRRRTGFGTKTITGLAASIERIMKETEPAAPKPQTMKVWALATDGDDNGTAAYIYTDEKQMYLDLAEKMGDEDEQARAKELADDLESAQGVCV